jgi:hypothetical protein
MDGSLCGAGLIKISAVTKTHRLGLREEFGRQTDGKDALLEVGQFRLLSPAYHVARSQCRRVYY